MKRFCEKQFWYPLCAAKGKQNGILVLYGRWWWNWKIWPRQDTERGVNVGWLPLTWHDNNFDLTIRPLLISEYPSQLPTTPYPDPSACLFVLVLGWWRADREDGMSADRQGCVVHRYTHSLAHSRNALFWLQCDGWTKRNIYALTNLTNSDSIAISKATSGGPWKPKIPNSNPIRNQSPAKEEIPRRGWVPQLQA